MIKLISLNIEGDRHLPEVMEFLKREKADVICLQEVLKDNITDLVAQTGYKVNFVPMTKVEEPTIWAQNVKGEVGIAILTKMKTIKNGFKYYFGGDGEVPIFEIDDFSNVWRVLLWVEVEKESKKYVIVNTHFTWTPKGQSDDKQRRDIKNLFKILDQVKEFVICGDFNAPRGGKIWGELAKKYKDNIPANVKSTLDLEYHRVPGLNLVVDGLFSTLEYKVGDVKVISGVSDHMAVAAEVRKVL